MLTSHSNFKRFSHLDRYVLLLGVEFSVEDLDSNPGPYLENASPVGYIM